MEGWRARSRRDAGDGDRVARLRGSVASLATVGVVLAGLVVAVQAVGDLVGGSGPDAHVAQPAAVTSLETVSAEVPDPPSDAPATAANPSAAPNSPEEPTSPLVPLDAPVDDTIGPSGDSGNGTDTSVSVAITGPYNPTATTSAGSGPTYQGSGVVAPGDTGGAPVPATGGTTAPATDSGGATSTSRTVPGETTTTSENPTSSTSTTAPSTSMSTASRPTTTSRAVTTTTRASATTTTTTTTRVPSTTATTTVSTTTTAAPSSDAGAPRQPPHRACDSAGRSGPAAAPPGAIVVPAGDNSGVDWSRARATYWFAPGRHTLGDGEFDQIIPGDGATFVGAPGAVLDGRNRNRYAFGGHAAGVTITQLTIERFGAPGANKNEGVVNHDAAPGWTLDGIVAQANAGAGVFLGHDNVVRNACLRGNGQYGFSAYRPEGVRNLTLIGNEIAANNTDDWETREPGCGCTGGGKFWEVDGATIIANWVHDNAGAGLWADTNNTDFLLERNFIAGNHAEGFFYEISYNATVRSNTFLRNGLVKGPSNPGFPTGAVYLSEAGGDSRVPGRTDVLEITGNLFVDNWSGVVAWESSDRYCGSPANTSSGACTRVNPDVTIEDCAPGSIESHPALDDCRWKTQRVLVHHNVFWSDPSTIEGCDPSRSCGVQALLSQWGTYPDWSPYRGFDVADAIVTRQDNHFWANDYRGPWSFVVHHQGNIASTTDWRSRYRQDRTSTFG